MSRKRRKRLKRERRRERAARRAERARRLRTQRLTKGNRNKSPGKGKKGKNDPLKIAGYENKKAYRKDKDKWKSAPLRQKNPAGYKSFLQREEAFKNPGQTQQTPAEPEAREEKKNKKDWELKGKELRSHERNIAATDKAAESLRKYKPKEIKGLKRNKYTNDLPPRPGFPKLPKITTPGGDLKVTRVDRPSGLKRDQDNRYDSPNSDYSNVYKNLKPSSSKKTKTVKPIKSKVISGGPKQVSRNPIKRK